MERLGLTDKQIVARANRLLGQMHAQEALKALEVVPQITAKGALLDALEEAESPEEAAKIAKLWREEQDERQNEQPPSRLDVWRNRDQAGRKVQAKKQADETEESEAEAEGDGSGSGDVGVG
jgi:hypothetical protein